MVERATSPGRDELVSALAQLTEEVQRFNSMLRNSRDLIEQHGSSTGHVDGELISKELGQIRARGGYLASRARCALEEFETVVPRQ